ncbi:hypothetical protein [Pararhodobacter aggregans]|nr:hypothetical protein [Pararhodobacter aggregans]PTX04255.1 hypothetical protein C8N33_102536 [Pararhodobacter aggregans]
MSQRAKVWLVVILVVVAVLVLAYASPEVARLLGQILRLIGLIGRAFG